MTEEEKAAAAKAAQEKAIKDMIDASVKTVLDTALKPLGDTINALANNQKVLADTMASDAAEKKKAAEAAAAAAAADSGTKPKNLDAEDVLKLLDERDAKRQQTAEQKAAREKFVGEKLGKLPAVYQNQLGADPAKWDEQAKSIQASFEKDLTDRGVKIENLGGASREGGNTPAAKGANDATGSSGDPAKWNFIQMPAPAVSNSAVSNSATAAAK